jgi:hypothetical protein
MSANIEQKTAEKEQETTNNDEKKPHVEASGAEQ